MSYVFRATCMLLISLCLFATAAAEVPGLISYQGRLTDSGGSSVADSTYNITFQMFEHDPPAMGESPLWESGPVPITTTDGMFVYHLGSSTPLPVSVFSDDNLDSYYVRTLVEGALLAGQGIQMVSVPFALRAASADTAQFAHVSPGGGGSGGWVDDGSVVHLLSSSDKVGIGTSSPTDKLVVGGNLGSSIDDTYIVTRNNHETYSGYKLGFNNDNYGWVRWNGLGEEMRFGTRTLGVNYLNTMVLKKGNVGINNLTPSEPLSIGPDLGASFGDLITIARTGTNRYSGIMMGEDSENKANIIWYNNENELRLQTESNNVAYSSTLVLKDGNVITGGTGNASVQLGDNAISAPEILDEPGIGRASQGGSTALPNEDWVTVCTRTCDFPAAGYAVVMVSADYATKACFYDLEVGLALNGTVAPRTFNRRFSQDNFDDLRCWDWTDLINLHEVFAVSAGSNTINFMANAHLYEATDYIQDVSMTVMYFPTAYATVNTTAQSHGDQLGSKNSSTQPQLYAGQRQLGSHSISSQQPSSPQVSSATIDQLRSENAELRRRLEAIEAKLKE